MVYDRVTTSRFGQEKASKPNQQSEPPKNTKNLSNCAKNPYPLTEPAITTAPTLFTSSNDANTHALPIVLNVRLIFSNDNPPHDSKNFPHSFATIFRCSPSASSTNWRAAPSRDPYSSMQSS